MKPSTINIIQKIIENPVTDEDEKLFQIKKAIYKAELRKDNVKESTSIIDLIAQNLEAMNDQDNGGILIKTGFQDFDEQFGGFSLGEFVVIGGRPAMGKTQLLVNLALNISQASPILYFTFDLSASLLTYRFISAGTGIAMDRILQNQLDMGERENVTTVAKKFANQQIYINESCNSSFSALKAHCQKQVEENGIKVIFVDYLQLMSTNSYRNSRELEIAFICKELKSIATELNVCVIATSQLNRKVDYRSKEHRQFLLSDLRDSGAIEQIADKVIFLSRPEYYGLVLEGNEDDNKNARDIAQIDLSDLFDDSGPFHIDESSENNSEDVADEVISEITNELRLIMAKNRNGSLGGIVLIKSDNFSRIMNKEADRTSFNFFSDRLNEINDEDNDAPF